jgi:hypothetical protein
MRINFSMTRLAPAMLWAFWLSCDPSVPESKRLADLSVDELRSVCKDLAKDYPPKPVICDGHEIHTGVSETDCSSMNLGSFPQTCQATVGDLRSCSDTNYHLSDAQVCRPTGAPKGCEAIWDCFLVRDGARGSS